LRQTNDAEHAASADRLRWPLSGSVTLHHTGAESVGV
jgi:hypothetical protein